MTRAEAPEPSRPSLAAEARQLVAASSRGVLATLIRQSGYPYASLIDLAPLPDGDVVTLLSTLAEHQHFLAADARAAMFIAPDLSAADALAQPRLTLVGRMERVEDKEAQAEAYLALHPQARRYLAFTDFDFYRLQVERVRFIAGFGRMGWIRGQAYRSAQP